LSVSDWAVEPLHGMCCGCDNWQRSIMLLRGWSDGGGVCCDRWIFDWRREMLRWHVCTAAVVCRSAVLTGSGTAKMWTWPAEGIATDIQTGSAWRRVVPWICSMWWLCYDCESLHDKQMHCWTWAYQGWKLCWVRCILSFVMYLC